MEWALLITITKAEYNGYGAPSAVEAQRRRVKLTTGSGRFCSRGTGLIYTNELKVKNIILY